MDQIERKRAPGDPEAESSAAKRRPIMTAPHSAFAAEKKMVKRHGQRGDAVMRESWGALPRTTAGGARAAISALTADLCGEAPVMELLHEEKRSRAPLVRDAQKRELAA